MANQTAQALERDASRRLPRGRPAPACATSNGAARGPADAVGQRHWWNLAVSLVVVFVFILALYTFDEVFFRAPDLSADRGDMQELREQTQVTEQLYLQWKHNHRVEVFEWQTRCSKIIFWVSVLITVVGVGFAFWQFTEASRSQRASEEADQMEIKGQLVSLAFKSRSLATFMMFVSLAYLVIFVTLVYPVRNHSPSGGTTDIPSVAPITNPFGGHVYDPWSVTEPTAAKSGGNHVSES